MLAHPPPLEKTKKQKTKKQKAKSKKQKTKRKKQNTISKEKPHRRKASPAVCLHGSQQGWPKPSLQLELDLENRRE